MVKVLVIGMDSVWLRGLLESAQTFGCEVARVDSVCDAFEVAASTAALPELVLVDADCCDDRSGPAFRALRARLLGVPFIVAYGPGSERVARTLSSDTVVAKRAAGDVVAARLCACALRPPRE